MADKPTFEQILLEGALNAVRTLSLDELHAQMDCLTEMDLPDDIAEFPRAVLIAVIAEKQRERAMN